MGRRRKPEPDHNPIGALVPLIYRDLLAISESGFLQRVDQLEDLVVPRDPRIPEHYRALFRAARSLRQTAGDDVRPAWYRRRDRAGAPPPPPPPPPQPSNVIDLLEALRRRVERRRAKRGDRGEGSGPP